jgi:hypothetical protein
MSAFVLLAIVVAGDGRLADRGNEKQLVAYAKGLRASRLDPALPRESVGDWIVKIVGAKNQVLWRSSDCGEKPDPPEPPLGGPLCVEFVADLGDVSVWGAIVVGTDRQGVSGEPRLKRVTVVRGRAEAFSSSRRLSELPKLLESAIDKK